MNWTVFGIFCYLFLAMQRGLSGLFTFNTGLGDLTPRFELVLVMFVGLFAPARSVIVAWMVVGALVDLLTPTPAGATLVGPHALAFGAGGMVMLQLRTLVLRTHALSHAFCVFCSGLAVALVAVSIFLVRSWCYQAEAPYPAMGALAGHALGALYTAVLAMVMTWPLIRLIPLFGLQLSRTARH
jgi:cell shape-determining protein MreD